MLKINTLLFISVVLSGLQFLVALCPNFFFLRNIISSYRTVQVIETYQQAGHYVGGLMNCILLMQIYS